MDVWVYGCMSVWAYGCMGVRVYRRMGAWCMGVLWLAISMLYVWSDPNPKPNHDGDGENSAIGSFLVLMFEP